MSRIFVELSLNCEYPTMVLGQFLDLWCSECRKMHFWVNSYASLPFGKTQLGFCSYPLPPLPVRKGLGEGGEETQIHSFCSPPRLKDWGWLISEILGKEAGARQMSFNFFHIHHFFLRNLNLNKSFYI